MNIENILSRKNIINTAHKTATMIDEIKTRRENYFAIDKRHYTENVPQLKIDLENFIELEKKIFSDVTDYLNTVGTYGTLLREIAETIKPNYNTDKLKETITPESLKQNMIEITSNYINGINNITQNYNNHVTNNTLEQRAISISNLITDINTQNNTKYHSKVLENLLINLGEFNRELLEINNGETLYCAQELVKQLYNTNTSAYYELEKEKDMPMKLKSVTTLPNQHVRA